MKKVVLVLLILITAITLAIIAIIIKNSATLSPSALEECKTLSFNGKGKTSLVFFSPEKEAEKYKNFLLGIKPFSENKEQFNFFYIDSYQPECSLYQNIALLCYNSELIKKASSCPNDFIIVLKSKEPSIRSSSYMNVLSLNSQSSPSVFAHELAHAISNLADEYIPAELPSRQKNCVAKCEKFEGETDGCFPGCSKSEMFRSKENGIMKTLNSKEYGIYNENLISEKISKISGSITGNAVQEPNQCESENYYLIHGDYKEGKIEITEKSVEEGCVGKNGAGDFDYKIVYSNEETVSEEFNPELIFTDSQSQEQEQINGQVLINQGNFFLKLPVIESSEKLEISKEGNLLAEVNLKDIGARPCKV